MPSDMTKHLSMIIAIFSPLDQDKFGHLFVPRIVTLHIGSLGTNSTFVACIINNITLGAMGVTNYWLITRYLYTADAICRHLTVRPHVRILWSCT